ncbi:hypothetical protein [Campylobacter hyointestinalis]|uniref:hypothetical protein n=1 Tax=Campylobacter hyointestinalis TaxID=198 RepID=UPI000CE533D4|nr:hypothetical protein [Campylobacter hyointestinalis]PPB55947.1 hypothetical protein CDQ70_09120 [Campylobacter hyointestinalis subsp. hyointestinalis]
MILAIFESIFSKIKLMNLALHFFTFSFHKKEEIEIYEEQNNREKRFERLKNELDKKHSFIRYAKKDEGTMLVL